MLIFSSSATLLLRWPIDSVTPNKTPDTRRKEPDPAWTFVCGFANVRFWFVTCYLVLVHVLLSSAGCTVCRRISTPNNPPALRQLHLLCSTQLHSLCSTQQHLLCSTQQHPPVVTSNTGTPPFTLRPRRPCHGHRCQRSRIHVVYPSRPLGNPSPQAPGPQASQAYAQ
jgi:hypothetical protein